MVAVAITRTELTAADLRGAAARARDADAVRRMLALALVLEGHSRAEAAEACGMDRQTLRDWIHRYNAEGLAGLSDRRPPGRRPHLTAEQRAEVAGWVERGPELERDGVVRWRRVPLRAQTRVSVPCWPTLASSLNQTSIDLPWADAGRTARARSAKPP